MNRMACVAAVALVLDQASKYAVRAYLALGQSIPLIPRLLRFTHERNSGAAFGMLAGKRSFFIVASVIVIAVLAFNAREVKDKPRLQVVFGLILGGALGNLLDRILLHWVTDFIRFSFFPATFNLADSALVVGVALFAFDQLVTWKKDSPSEG